MVGLSGRDDELLRWLVEATAGVTGEEFFKNLTRYLARALGVQYAWVAEFTDTITRVRTLAFCSGEEWIENFEYELGGEPCEKVYETGSLCLYRDGLCQLFPTDPNLPKLKAESYLGIPLITSDNRTLGHIAAIDTKPMIGEERDISIFKIFANRALAELERLQAERVVETSRQQLAGILDSAMDAVVALDHAGRIKFVNRAAEEIFLFDGSAIIGTSFEGFMTDAFARAVSAFSSSEDRSSWLPKGLSARRSDGSLFSVEATVSRAVMGTDTAFTLILRDLTEREKTEGEIRRLQNENLTLAEELRYHYNVDEVIGRSAALQKCMQQVQRVATTDSTVLLTGETGTGKELFARLIHTLSNRRDKVMIKLNCAALPASLVESELFGHEKGAFTGAVARKKGRFELADEGTLFLDEVGELSPEIQSKLLRVLQEQEFERLGGTETVRVRVRLVAATNRNLEESVKSGTFREDLYYRLNIFPIHVPPLRERSDDIPLLSHYLLQKFTTRMGKPDLALDADALAMLSRYNWPGNIRELSNVMERAAILCDGDKIRSEHIGLLESSVPRQSVESVTLEEAERRHILRALEQCSGVVGGRTGAAAVLGINRTTLLSKMKKLGITAK